jgi:glutamine amidotransferase
MCRHLLYLGPPVTLASLLLEPPHSLLHQSWAPRAMRGGGTMNADGFGVGWYPAGSPAPAGPTSRTAAGPVASAGAPGSGPVRYRRDCPIWTDENFARLAAATSSDAVLGAVRSATVGMPVLETACAPFTEGPWLFSLNGVVFGWPDSVTKLAEGLPVADLLGLDAPTDAALVWALVRHRLRGGVLPKEAVAETAREVTAAAPGSRLNLLLTDGVTGVATTVGHSLSWRRDAGSVLVASEPLDSAAGWHDVPDGQLLTLTNSTVDISPLERDKS